jgi:hypothetical protein
MKRSELVQNVINWDNRFPLDRWWRMKHNIPFMSPAHRESSFLFQLFEFEEDKLFLKTVEKEEKDDYIPGIGEFLKSEPSMESFANEAQREIEKLLKQEENGR